ncbi:hypothetical protein PB01_11260 [Psychrobacillus glaciei]|uniref:Uncharacterized protein n=1 Tax=Psychrobacillus glaciei TaxID=2283160 RepID=A0A5J6SN25_9BACI|nr:hypothetical protein [Psychrobacillus glaciei]QFF99355.1 hypothetical protein PB01_11260 [Psychrobacillus glaciei]
MADKMKQHFYQRWWFILIVLILGIGIFENIVNRLEKVETDRVEVTDSSFYKKMEREELKEKMSQKNKTPEVVAAEIIMKNFGTTYVEKEKAVLSSRFESGVVEAIALEEKVKSAKSSKRSFLYNTVEFMKAMKSQEEVTQATLIVQAPLTDRYGNVGNEDVMIVLMSRETLNKINFNNFKAENLSAIADSYWEHPALSAK